MLFLLFVTMHVTMVLFLFFLYLIVIALCGYIFVRSDVFFFCFHSPVNQHCSVILWFGMRLK